MSPMVHSCAKEREYKNHLLFFSWEVEQKINSLKLKGSFSTDFMFIFDFNEKTRKQAK